MMQRNVVTALSSCTDSEAVTTNTALIHHQHWSHPLALFLSTSTALIQHDHWSHPLEMFSFPNTGVTHRQHWFHPYALLSSTSNDLIHQYCSHPSVELILSINTHTSLAVEFSYTYTNSTDLFHHHQ
jgi:hypothetical protein